MDRAPSLRGFFPWLMVAFTVPVLLVSLAAPFLQTLGGYVESPRWISLERTEPELYPTPDVPSRFISFNTTEGTFMGVDVSPDGRTLIFDLLGDLYRLPFEGGEAIPVTSGRSWDQAPLFSPDGKSVFFISDRQGFRSIWRIELLDGSLHQVTQNDSHVFGVLNWSRDGTRLLANLGDAATGNTEFIPHSIDPVTGTMTPIDAPDRPWFDPDTFEVYRPAIRIFSAVPSSDGNMYFAQSRRDSELDRRTVSLRVFNTRTKVYTDITTSDASYNEYMPQISHDGELLAYFRQYDDRRTEIRICDLASGSDKSLVELANADDAYNSSDDGARPHYAFTPDDVYLIFWHGGKIHRVNVAHGTSEIVPFRVRVERKVWERAKPVAKTLREADEATIIRWPVLSRDGRRLVFAAVGHVWIMELCTGEMRRLTGPSDFGYMPALSPDGSAIAYVSFTESAGRTWISRLMVVSSDGGAPRPILAGANEVYLLPQWSPDGQKIALIREKDSGSGSVAAFGWTSVTNGTFHHVASAPLSSEPSSWFIYARFVGFDTAGRNLLFSYPRSRKMIVLDTARLDGQAQRTLAIGTSEVGGITPSPDLRNVALTRRDGTVWVVPFNAGARRNRVSTLASEARRVSAGGGYYVNWSRPTQMTFGFGRNVYRHTLNRDDLESLRITVPFRRPMAKQPIAFTGARLITMSGEEGAGSVIEPGTIVLKGQRITAIGRTNEVGIPPDAIVVDAAGETIIPGLVDTHYHRIGGSGGAIGLSSFKLPNPNFNDYSAIQYGVTTAWEPGGPANDGSPATADLQRAGRILGPRWSQSATGAVGYPWDQLTTYSKTLAAVMQHEELGVSVLKEYNTPTRQQQQWLSMAAHQLNLGISSHLQSLNGMLTRVVDGYTGGDHPHIQIPFYKDVRELLRRSGYVWAPNIVLSSGSVGGYKDTECYFWNDLREKRPREYDHLKDMKSSSCDGLESDAESTGVPYSVHRVSRAAKQAAMAANSGVHVAVSGHNMPGLRLHQEMWFLSKGGMPIDDILRAATMGNAEKLGLQEEIGSLEPGKIADLLVLDENPLAGILNTLSLRYTVQAGAVYDSDAAQRAVLVGSAGK